MLFLFFFYFIFDLFFFSFPRDSIATTEMATGTENDYDGSTDEETENLTRASLPSGKTQCIVFGEYHGQANLFFVNKP